MLPFSAVSERWMTAMSPSWIPASIMDSPSISRAKCSPDPSRLAGISTVWVLSRRASIGVPAAMRP